MPRSQIEASDCISSTHGAAGKQARLGPIRYNVAHNPSGRSIDRTYANR